jgi:hypothetical protein
MITNVYNRTAEILCADNGVVEQGELLKNMAVVAASVANRNQTPAPSSNTSFAKSFQDDNPITQEMATDGLASLFGAATGLDGLEMIMDYGCDVAEFYDDYVQDRVPRPAAQQYDPRLWMPTPHLGMSMAA